MNILRKPILRKRKKSYVKKEKKTLKQTGPERIMKKLHFFSIASRIVKFFSPPEPSQII